MRKLLVQVAVSILRLRSPRTEALRKWATGIAASNPTMRRRASLATESADRRVNNLAEDRGTESDGRKESNGA